MIPVRGGLVALTLRFDLSELMGLHADVNRVAEQAWAGLLQVMRDSWPDWPVEVWAQLEDEGQEPDDDEADGEAPFGGWQLCYRVSFGGEDAGQRDVAAMAHFIVQGLSAVFRAEPRAGWGPIGPDDRALWAIDDGDIYRFYADERTAEPSVFLIGHYAGEPALFAATLEAWPLRGAGAAVLLDDVDTGWAFG